MTRYRNSIIIIFLAVILFLIFFLKSSNVQVDNNISDYKIKCINCLSYNGTILSFSDTFTINVSAIGYKSELFELSHGDGFNLVTLKPSKVSLIINYDIEPKNVELLINDIKKQFKNEILFDPGDYKIKIISDNYFTYEKVITLNPTDNAISIDLSENKIVKNIKFLTLKETLYKLNGSNIIENESIYTLTEKSNFISFETNGVLNRYEINIVDNNKQTINLDNIVKNQNIGILIETIPTGAAVRVNDTYRGLSPVFVSDDKINNLGISAAGYNDYSSTNFVVTEESKILIKLKPILAKVTINSSPISDIYINNNFISSTPKSLELPVGQHHFSLVKNGYQTVTKKINIENSIELKYDEVLLTHKQHALAISPNKYKNKKGIELILMSPSKIQLGSPEDEKRRSRNEIQRNVSISKHFYASKHIISEKIYNSVMGGSPSNSMLPKVKIDWNEAAIFANKLSDLEGLEKFYEIKKNKVTGANLNSTGYRLLSEAEWELCASENYKKTIYPWGNKEIIPPIIGNLAGEENNGKLKFFIKNYRDDYVKISKVGSFKENKNGFTDIIGNVSEWVHDFYSEDFLSVANETITNYLGPSFGNSHVVKGSNYQSANQTELGISYRAGVIGPSELIGFRVARWIY